MHYCVHYCSYLLKYNDIASKILHGKMPPFQFHISEAEEKDHGQNTSDNARYVAILLCTVKLEFNSVHAD